MAGTIDPQKCNAAKKHLIMTTLNYFTSGSSIRDLAMGRSLNGFQMITLSVMPPLQFLLYKVMPDKPFWYPATVKQVWDDCDIGGGLKQKLEQFKVKASEVAKKLLPAPSPVPTRVGVGLSTYNPIAIPEITARDVAAIERHAVERQKIMEAGAALAVGGTMRKTGLFTRIGAWLSSEGEALAASVPMIFVIPPHIDQDRFPGA